MIPFFKQKTTASEIGIALLQVLSTDLSSVLNNLEAGYDRQRIHDELVYLKAFVIDYATSLSLGNNSPETKAILNVYYINLHEMAKKGTLSADFYENLYYKRLPVYEEAVKTPHKLGSPWTVGVAFANFCGAYLDIKMTMLGSSVFVEQCEAISKVLKSYRITV